MTPEKPKWEHPFGIGYQNRNQVEKYLREIFYAVDEDHVEGLKEVLDELDIEQYTFINNLLASHTRKKIKSMLADQPPTNT